MVNFTLGAFVTLKDSVSTYVVISKVYNNKVNGLRIRLTKRDNVKNKQHIIEGMPILITGMCIVVDCEEFECLNVDCIKHEDNFLGLTHIDNLDLYKVIITALCINNPLDYTYRRGNVLLVNLEGYVLDVEQLKGLTPCVVISNNANNYTLDVITVIPLKKSKELHEFETGIPDSENNVIHLEEEYTVITSGIRSVPKSCVNEDVGVLQQLSSEVLHQVSENLATMLGLVRV